MSKICGICAEDCSERPRIKDRKGRYFCKACVAERTAARATGAGVIAAAPQAEPAQNAQFELDDGGAFELDDAEPGARPLPIDMLSHAKPAAQCPGCARTMPPGARICVSCGYDMEKGIQSSTMVEKSTRRGKRGHFCHECGYDLKGLREPVCPECGTRIKANKHERWDKQTERDVIRTEWTKPLVTAGIGLVGLLVVMGMRDMFDAAPYIAMFIGAEIVIGYAVLWISFTFLGDIGTPLLNLVRLTALYLVVDSLWILVSAVPSFWLRNSVTGLAYVGLFTNFFDVDWQDAWFVMIFNWFVKMALIVTAAVMLTNYL